MATRKKTAKKTVTKKTAPKAATTKKKKGASPARTAGARKPLDYQINTAANKAMTQRNTLFFKLPEGTTTLRIMPQFDGSPTVFTRADLHYKVKNEDGSRNIAPACLATHGQDDDYCYMCAFVDWLKSSGDPALEEIGRNMYANPQLTVQAWVWDKSAKTWFGPKLVKLSKGVADELSDMLSLAEDNDMPYFCDPHKGQAIGITKTGSGMGTKYKAQSTGKFEDMDKIVPDWEKQVITDLWTKLDVKVLTASEQKAALHRTFPDLPWDEIQAEIG